MSKKTWITICVLIGSTIGGYIPLLWGAGVFSFSALLTSSIGGLLGVWLGYQLGE